MKLSYKYRIYPNIIQKTQLNNILSFCKNLYNSALEERISAHKKDIKINYYTQAAQLKGINDIFSEAENIHSQTLQAVLKQLDSAFSNFFRRVKSKSGKAGFPRFKSLDRFKSILFPQCDLNSGGVKRLPNNKLKIKGLSGEIKVEWHRPFEGRCKTVRVSKSADKYYVILLCDDVPSEHLAPTGKTIAIDLGLTSFITADDGTKFHHPKSYKTAKEKLAYLNQKLAAKQRGSNNRRRAKQSLARVYEKVVNVKNNFLHKVTKQLVTENDTIVIEKLNIKLMLEAKGFEVNKGNIQDASWARFASLLSYKAERAGRILIEVNPRNTSKMCSGCGKVKQDLTLRDREYNCDACGIAINRDLNAAINIRRLGTSLATNKVVSEAPAFRQG